MHPSAIVLYCFELSKKSCNIEDLLVSWHDSTFFQIGLYSRYFHDKISFANCCSSSSFSVKHFIFLKVLWLWLVKWIFPWKWGLIFVNHLLIISQYLLFSREYICEALFFNLRYLKLRKKNPWKKLDQIKPVIKTNNKCRKYYV